MKKEIKMPENTLPRAFLEGVGEAVIEQVRAQKQEQGIQAGLSGIFAQVAKKFEVGFTVIQRADLLQIEAGTPKDDDGWIDYNTPSISVGENKDGTFCVNHGYLQAFNNTSPEDTLKALGRFYWQNAPKML